MKIKELIEKLKEFPEDYEILYYQPFTFIPGECNITEISVKKEKQVWIQ